MGHSSRQKQPPPPQQQRQPAGRRPATARPHASPCGHPPQLIVKLEDQDGHEGVDKLGFVLLMLPRLGLVDAKKLASIVRQVKRRNVSPLRCPLRLSWRGCSTC